MSAAKHGKKKSSSHELSQEIQDQFIYIITSPWRVLKALCFFVGLGVICVSALLSLYLYFFFSSLPQIEIMTFAELKSLAQESIEDRMEPPRRAQHRWIRFQNISKDLIYVITISEDSKFFDHDGVDYEAMLRAVSQNWKAKAIKSGASTITQQVVKNLFFDSSKSLKRKIKEVLVAQDLDDNFTKNEILELYLNIAEFGPNLFGVNEAAYHFFRKKAGKIKPHEAVFMSLMLPSPRRNHYKIFEKQNLSGPIKKKMKRIYQQMFYRGLINKKDYSTYLKYTDYFRYSKK